MASGTLYTYPKNFRAYKILIAAQYSGAQIKVADNFVFGQTNKTKEFLKKFPLGKVPAFETSDGHYITESNAIAYYVASDALRGKTDIDRALILQWLDFADSEILPASCAWVFPLIGIMPYNVETVENAKEDAKKTLATLNSYLLSHTFLVGERITLADICVAMTLLHLYEYVLHPELRKPYENVNRWFQTVIHQPEVSRVIGPIQLALNERKCESEIYEPDIFPGKSSKKQKKEKESKKEAKESKESKESKKESKEPKAEKAPEDEADATEEALAAEPKKKNPFASMPKSSFDLDDFKRFYSNEDVSKSIPYLWQKFDPENYSIWICHYKYNKELTKIFMSCNLISGMYQRLDSMRKGAFASCCIFGEDNDNTISGIWIWRGQDFVFNLSPDWQVDYESYDWNKLDPSDDETKKLVEKYLSWTGADAEGRRFNQGKIFK